MLLAVLAVVALGVGSINAMDATSESATASPMENRETMVQTLDSTRSPHFGDTEI
jgi:hypothetical protein